MSNPVQALRQRAMRSLLKRQSGIDLAATAPRVTDYGNGERSVRFVAMQHIATRPFYDAAIEVVRTAKEDGYVHLYEFIDMYALDDVGQRKMRKLTRFLPMPDRYAAIAETTGAQVGLELVAQDHEGLLGLANDRDVNADLAPQELLRRVEEALGPLELTQEDLETPLTEAISQGIASERWAPVVLDGRNAHLAACVHEAPDERIVITFGAAHEPGWLAELQKLDPGWAPVVGAATPSAEAAA